MIAKKKVFKKLHQKKIPTSTSKIIPSIQKSPTPPQKKNNNNNNKNPTSTSLSDQKGWWFWGLMTDRERTRDHGDVVTRQRHLAAAAKVGGLILVSAFSSIKAAVQSIVGRMVAWTFAERFPNSRMTWMIGGEDVVEKCWKCWVGGLGREYGIDVRRYIN